MRLTVLYTIGLLFLFSVGLLDAAQTYHKENDDSKKLDTNIRRLISDVDSRQISKHLFYLAKDPLPYRKLNFTLPGHEKNTLYEANDYLAGKLKAWGYHVKLELPAGQFRYGETHAVDGHTRAGWHTLGDRGSVDRESTSPGSGPRLRYGSSGLDDACKHVSRRAVQRIPQNDPSPN